MQMDGKELNSEWLAERYEKRNKIMLIKAYRYVSYVSNVSNLGLKDAKDAVETAMAHGFQGLYALFAPYLNLPDYADYAKIKQYSKEMKKELDEEATGKTIVSAITCACKHWHTLGFSSCLSACTAVLNNLKDKLPEIGN
jgi:hypothetical protein